MPTKKTPKPRLLVAPKEYYLNTFHYEVNACGLVSVDPKFNWQKYFCNRFMKQGYVRGPGSSKIPLLLGSGGFTSGGVYTLNLVSTKPLVPDPPGAGSSLSSFTPATTAQSRPFNQFYFPFSILHVGMKNANQLDFLQKFGVQTKQRPNTIWFFHEPEEPSISRPNLYVLKEIQNKENKLIYEDYINPPNNFSYPLEIPVILDGFNVTPTPGCCDTIPARKIQIIKPYAGYYFPIQAKQNGEIKKGLEDLFLSTKSKKHVTSWKNARIKEDSIH